MLFFLRSRSFLARFSLLVTLFPSGFSITEHSRLLKIVNERPWLYEAHLTWAVRNEAWVYKASKIAIHSCSPMVDGSGLPFR